jgi:uncharacterized protein
MSPPQQKPEAVSVLVSADSHINEPPELWSSLRNYGTRAPHVTKEGGTAGFRGDWFLAEEIRPFPLSMNNAGAFPKAERSSRLFDFDFARDASPAAYRPDARLGAMDADNTQVEVLYPSYGMRFPCMRDPELQYASLRVSNNWLAEFCRASPKRFIGVAALSLHDTQRAIDDLHWCLNQGIKGISVLPTAPVERPYSSMHYDRFWAAAAEAEVPVSLHALPPLENAAASGRVKPSLVDNRAMALIEDFHLPNVLYDHSIQRCLTQIVLSGVLERHPRLRLVLAEWGTSWIPNFMANLDGTYTGRPEGLSLKLLPSEYLLRQVWFTFDRSLALTPEVAGRLQDRLMWASDFPHIESTWPESRQVFEESVKGLSSDIVRKLAADNCARLYRLEVQ